jgi:hypothetical protein
MPRSSQPTSIGLSGAPTGGAIQIPAIATQALKGRISGTSQMAALTAEKRPVLAAVQSNHGAEVVALDTVGATQCENNLLPCVCAPWVFHVSGYRRRG